MPIPIEAAAPPNVQEADVFVDIPDENRRYRGSAPKPSVHASEFVTHEVDRIRREVVLQPNRQNQEEKAAPPHAKIRAVADVLTAIQAEDARTLRQWFTIAKNGARYKREDAVTWHSIGWVTIAGELREFIGNWAMEAESDDDALLRIAQGWAQHEINEAIGGDRQVGTTSSARVVFDQDRKRMT